MIRRFSLILCLSAGLLSPVFTQRSGETTYSFLGLTNSARVTALGGKNISIMDDDINLVFHNPALLTEGMNQDLTLNYVNYLAGVNFGYASYAFSRLPLGNFSGGIHYINYGTFDRTDEYGEFSGTFRASEYALNLVYSRSIIDTFLTVGVNLKPIFSSLEQYNSFGLALDLGAVYHNPRSNTSIGLVFKNIGTQITSYTGVREKLPFEIEAGISQRLAHAPFRFNITFQNLERWDLTYDTGGDSDFNTIGDTREKSKFDIFGDKLMRHMIFGVEFLAGEHFHVDLGYNYRRRAEMKVDNRPGMVGFSFGFGLKVSKFHIAYGRSSYHLAGGTNHFSLTTSLSEFYRK